MLSKLVSCGDSDCTDLVESDHSKPELVVTLKDKHDFVALLDSKREKVVGASCTLFLYIQESKSTLYFILIQMDHGKLFRVFLSYCIDNIEAEVEGVCVLELNTL